MTEIPVRLKEKLDKLPELPGIYKMLDSRGAVLYIGKSKCLKKRVRSYFTGKQQWSKTRKMVLLTHDIETVVTDTHLEARLLECQLIKEFKPVFNSQMKNDREYVYLKIENDPSQGTLSVTDERTGDLSFGPFRREYSLKEKIGALACIFPITKKDGGYKFEYHVFPVELDRKSFDENRDCLIEIFSDNQHMDMLVNALKSKMETASEAYKFETAARLRDAMNALNYIGNMLWRYKEIMSRNIFLKIPVGQKFKFFYISNGAIVLNEDYINPTAEDIDLFIRKGCFLKEISSLERNEKADLDYRDILYSEISSLPDDWVYMIPDVSPAIQQE